MDLPVTLCVGHIHCQTDKQAYGFARSHALILIIQCHTVQNYTLPERNGNTCALSGTTSIWIQITCKLQMFDDALLSVVNWFMYQNWSTLHFFVHTLIHT